MGGEGTTGGGGRPRLLVACRALGVPSEVWLWRQVEGLVRFDRHVMCWEDGRSVGDGDGRVAVHVLGTAFEAPERGARRWVYRLRMLPSGNVMGASGRERERIERLFDEVGPGLVLCHFGHTALRVLPVAKRRGVPVVVHFHGYDIFPKLEDKYYRWSLRNSFGDFAAMVVVGSHQREVLIRMGADAGRIHLIPCGAPTGEFEPGPAGGVRPCRFIGVSRMEAWKGVDYTLRAFRLALGRVPGIELHLVGGGEMEAELRRMAQDAGLGGAVHFHGVQPAAEVRRLLRECDVFVQHSVAQGSGRVEGFGVSIAEASATGLPVVVTRTGGIADQVVDGETGWLVAERDVEGMAAAMVELARDPAARRRMGMAGRQRVVEHFDTSRQVAKLEAVLLGVLGGDGCRRPRDGGAPVRALTS